MVNTWKMFKHLKYLATLLVLTQFFVLTFPAQSTYGLDTKDTATSFYESGISKLSLQDYRGAIQDFNKAIKLNPNDVEAFYGRGLSKDSLEDYKGAIEDLNKAIELDPKYVEAFSGRGIAKISLGQKSSGCLDLSKAGELGMSEAYDLIKKLCN